MARALVAALLAVTAVSGTVAASGPRTPGREALLDELGRGRTVVDRATGNVSSVAGSRANPAAPRSRLGGRSGPQAAASAFVARYGSLWGVRDGATSLAVSRVEAAAGTTTVRFQQDQGGVPVISGELMVQVDGEGNVISATGEATDSRAAGTSPTLTPARAVAGALAAVRRDAGVQRDALRATTPELAIYDPSLLGAPGPGGARLVWRVEVTNSDRTVDEYVLVDAMTGAVALRFSQVHHAKSRLVCTGGTGSSLQGNANVPCLSPGWRDTSPPPPSFATGNAKQREILAAFEFSGDLYDLFYNRFGRDSIDDAGAQLISTVRYCGGACTNYNAYWDGYQAIFWPGMATDDIVAHEFGHGFTEHTSNLLYYHQSGALNEALSDILGELVDLTNSATDPADRWLMGEESVLGAIRDMQDPTLGNDPANGQPDRMQSPLWWAGEDDNFGVHTNSGVANKAAFLMVEGGSFNGVDDIVGLGVDKAAAIWYRVATQHLWSGSDYADLAAGLGQACTDLIGVAVNDGSGADTGDPIDAADCAEVDKVIEATEMLEQPSVPGAVAPAAPDCVSGSYALSFVDDFDTGLGGWTPSNTRFATSDIYSESAGLTLHGRTLETAGSGAATRDLGTLTPGMPTFVTFRHAYVLDHFFTLGYDGGVVEYSLDGGPWTDARALFTHNGYNGTVYSYPGGGNPLAGRAAFTGWSPGHLTSRLDLTNLTGHSVRLRFVAGTDADIGDYGWFIDDFKLFTCAGATDIGAPLVSVPNASFRTGVAVNGSSPVKLSVAFDASDVSGVESTALQRRTNTGAWSSVALGSPTAESANLDYVVSSTKKRQFRASASDMHGNATGWVAATPFRVLAVQNGSSAVVQQGAGWATKSNSGFYGGSVLASSASGARQRLTRVMSDVAIVTTLAPGRGKLDVYIDGVLRTPNAIDTASASTQYRQVVFAWDFGAPGTHTIELRVLGTGRVDFDAFLVLAP